MVRVNIIEPSALADQHLGAEYVEILMLEGYILKHPEPTGIPLSYKLGAGHIKFFKNKLTYLQKRHNLIKLEMTERNFKPEKSLNLDRFSSVLHNDWSPSDRDVSIIKQRIKEKILMKPDWYRYKGEYVGKDFLLDLLEKAKGI